MADDDIQGTVTDGDGNGISNATVVVFEQGNPYRAFATQADSNGNYIFTEHPDGDGTTKDWHLAARDPNDSSRQFRSLHSVSAALPEGGGIPDSVNSRPNDDQNTGNTSSFGLVINPNESFEGVGARISNNTTGVTRSRLYDYSAGSYIETVDISALSSGDAFKFDSTIDEGVDYGIEVDDSGNSYTVGYRSDETAYPYSGTDIDIIARSVDASQNSSADVIGVNDIGNPDNVL